MQESTVAAPLPRVRNVENEEKWLQSIGAFRRCFALFVTASDPGWSGDFGRLLPEDDRERCVAFSRHSGNIAYPQGP
jgi:hypothetical protein